MKRLKGELGFFEGFCLEERQQTCFSEAEEAGGLGVVLFDAVPASRRRPGFVRWSLTYGGVARYERWEAGFGVGSTVLERKDIRYALWFNLFCLFFLSLLAVSPVQSSSGSMASLRYRIGPRRIGSANPMLDLYRDVIFLTSSR